MNHDASTHGERAALAVASRQHDGIRWNCRTRVSKAAIPIGFGPGRVRHLGDLHHAFGLAAELGEQRIAGRTAGQLEYEYLLEQGVAPELVDIEGNLLMYGGASCQWQTLIGNGTATGGQVLTYFSNAQAAIGVGDTATAAAATQTDLLGTTYTTNKLRVAMDATYPLHTDATTAGAASIVFRSTFSTSQANFAWQEWGVFNSSSAATGRMLNRKVESLGTKTSAASWQLTVTLSIA